MESDRNIDSLQQTVSEWPGIELETGPGPIRGTMTTFRLGKREIGHLHPEGVVHVPFPRAVREDLLASGTARQHSAGIESHVEVPFNDEDGLKQSIQVLRMSYDRAVAANARRNGSDSS